MKNNAKRHLLHAAGAVALLSLIPLSATFGVLSTVGTCLVALGCFTASGFIKPEVGPPRHSTAPREPFVCPFEVQFDAVEIRVLKDGTLEERVNWADLSEVGVVIDGAYLPAPWWLLFTAPKSGCRFPNEARGGREILEALQSRLPGFDNRAVIEAMSLMEGSRLVWSRAHSHQATQ